MDFNHTNLPIENELPKLIRDKMPEKIKKNEGKTAITWVAEKDEVFLHFILKKLAEETAELKEEEANKEEITKDICDIVELLESLKKLLHISNEQVDKIRKEKIEKHGGFDKRLIFEGKKKSLA